MIVNKNVVFSIIMPLYNSEKHIGNTIQSVIKQTYEKWELIVVDDCSTDNSREIVRKVERNDNRVRLITSDVNFGGPAKPRNMGIRSSVGKYIAFLDSDDIWYRNKLEVCLQYFNNTTDVMYHDLLYYGSSARTFFRRRVSGRRLKKPVLVDLLINGNALNNSSVIVRKNIVDKVGGLVESKEMIAAEDYNLWLKISKVTNKFLYIPEILGEYFVGDNNISSKNMYFCSKYASKDFERYLKDNEKIKYYSRLSYLQARYLYLNNDYDLSRKYLYEVLKVGSINLRIKAMYMFIFLNVKVYFKQL